MLTLAAFRAALRRNLRNTFPSSTRYQTAGRNNFAAELDKMVCESLDWQKVAER